MKTHPASMSAWLEREAEGEPPVWDGTADIEAHGQFVRGDLDGSPDRKLDLDLGAFELIRVAVYPMARAGGVALEVSGGDIDPAIDPPPERGAPLDLTRFGRGTGCAGPFEPLASGIVD